MIRTEREKVYLVKKGSKRFIVEIHRDSEGRVFVVPIYATYHSYETKSGDVKEWNYDMSKAEEIEYKDLPRDIRAALSRLQVI